LDWNPQGYRRRDRPKRTWRRKIEDEIRNTWRSWNEVKVIAGDRKAWKLFMDVLCSTRSKRNFWCSSFTACCYRMRRKYDHYRQLCIWKETVVNIQKYHLNFIVLRDWGNEILYLSGYLTVRLANEFNITQMQVSINNHRR
jgi:hypothetical protein